MEQYFRFREKIIFHVDLNMDIAQELTEEFSKKIGNKMVLCPDPISCLNGFKTKKYGGHSHAPAICYVNITCKNPNLVLDIRKIIAAGTDIIVMGKPIVDRLCEIHGLEVLSYIIENEINPGLNGANSFGKKLGLIS